MQQRADSIAPSGHATAALLRACCVAWLVGVMSLAAQTVRAEPASPLATQLFYSAPASCPRQAELERRLRARLRGVALDTSAGSTRLEIRIEQRGHVHGSIVLSSQQRVLGQRDIEARQCGEAVDAIAFIAALLLEEGARTTTDAGPQEAPPATASASEPPPARALDEPATSTAAAAAQQTDLAGSELPAAAPSAGAEDAPSTTSARQREATPATPTPGAATAAVSSDRVPARGVPASARSRARRAPAAALEGALLLVSGVLPSVRPGLAASASLAIVGNARASLSFSLGMRATLPQQVQAPDGTGRFAWWSSVGSLCAELYARPDLSASLCATAELGRLIARGLETDAAVTRRTRWLALGPTARASVQLVGPLWLEPAFGLLLPTTRDRFVVGASELHAVPRLTFRGELGLRVRFE